MIAGRRRRRAPSGVLPGRRTGPPGEVAWWDPSDQEVAERPLLGPGDLGRWWRAVPMVNNAERLEPLGDDPASLAVRAARGNRQRTALDEGRAWRRGRAGPLAVLRLEAFADADEGAHRAAWLAHGEAALDATWRARWVERERSPGWIEARWAESSGAGGGHQVPDAIDWLRIEDHTDPSGAGAVAVYEHLTIWAGRWQATLTVRHGLDEEVAVAPAATALLVRLAPLA